MVDINVYCKVYRLVFILLMVPILGYSQGTAKLKARGGGGKSYAILKQWDANGKLVRYDSIAGSRLIGLFKKQHKFNLLPYYIDKQILPQNPRNNKKSDSTGKKGIVVKKTSGKKDANIFISLPNFNVSNEKYNFKSFVQDAYERANIRLIIRKKDGKWVWPDESSEIYQVIEKKYGTSLIDSIKTLVKSDEIFTKQQDLIEYHSIKVDSLGSLQLDFHNPKARKEKIVKRKSSLESQIEELSEKVDALLSNQNVIIKEYLIRLEELINEIEESESKED